VWELFQSRPKKIVTYDEIAKVTWGDEVDTKFSLEAIAKLIDRLRRKFKPKTIYSVRGTGFYV
jgi:DNA-binding response OmpR family regulator